MATFTLTDKAKSDLKDIARFTQKRWGREQRNQYLKDLDACFFRLVLIVSLNRLRLPDYLAHTVVLSQEWIGSGPGPAIAGPG